MKEIQNAEIEWLDNGTPFSRQFRDIYFSTQDGLAESKHVFIDGNNLQTRWQERQNPYDPFFVAELGFGSGLNFLLCWQLLDRLAIDSLHLHYLAFEKYPLTMDDLRQAQSLWPELEKYSSQLRKLAVPHTAGLHRLCLSPNVTLDLYFGDALEGMLELFPDCGAIVDCWFMDGFAPSRNPALWDESIIELMWHHSRPESTVSTYSVAGQVRRSLQKAGFQLKRLPGFGNKREMLLAHRGHVSREQALQKLPSRDHHPAWYRISRSKPLRHEAVIIGAGLAGCSTAFSLARKGWQVTLVDSASTIAAGASGNRQGILQPRLAAERTIHAGFYVHALLYAHRQFNQLQESQDIGWHPGGVIRLPDNARPGLNTLLNRPEDYYSPEVLTVLSAKQTSEITGLTLSGNALYLPHGGWLRPADLCQAYLNTIASAKIRLITRQEVSALRRESNQWQIMSGTDVVAEAPVVVLSNSFLANNLPQTAFLPVLPVRGQLTEASGNSNSAKLRSAVVGEKYICPADKNLHSIGASYRSGTTDISCNADEDKENLQGINNAFARPDQLGLTAEGSRASIRCNSVDYFPIVGAVPDYQDFISVFAPLSRNAEVKINQRARYHPDLYVNSAHGSYGLASCPLSSEYLASLISKESPPITTTMADSLSPARFIIRELKKQRVRIEN